LLGVHLDRLLPTNDKVHAAGALDVDFKSDAPARARATPGSWDLAAETDPAARRNISQHRASGKHF